MNARLRSLDVFRGLTVAGMVIVNNPGDWSTVYWPLLHAEWNGWTPTDLIFPFFLFIVGTAIGLGNKVSTVPTILRRGASIWGLGLFLAAFPYFRLSTVRVPGVLARIAWCYVASALLARSIAEHADRRRIIRTIVVFLLVSYWILLVAVPFPGGYAGDLSAEGNIGAWLDREIFGRHLWRQGNWDPEGLLSTVPAIGTTLLGVIAAAFLAVCYWICDATDSPMVTRLDLHESFHAHRRASRRLAASRRCRPAVALRLALLAPSQADLPDGLIQSTVDGRQFSVFGQQSTTQSADCGHTEPRARILRFCSASRMLMFVMIEEKMAHS